MPPEIEIPEIRGIAPPLPPDIPWWLSQPSGTSWPLYVWILIAVGLLALVIISVMVLVKMLRSPMPASSYDPRESALTKLHELKEDYVKLSATEFALQASHGLREYLTAFYGSATPFETGREFLHRQEQQRLMNESKYVAVQDLYTRAEALKYAPSPGADGQRLDLVQDMISFVRNDVPGIQLEPTKDSASDADPLPA